MNFLFNHFISFKSLPLIMIIFGILIHHGVMQEWTTGKGCGGWCIWLGAILYIALDFILVDWWYVFKKNDFIHESLLTFGSAIGNAIVSFGILTFILSQAEIINFYLVGSVIMWIIGGYVSMKFRPKQEQIKTYTDHKIE